jgi:hypothetical protein
LKDKRVLVVDEATVRTPLAVVVAILKLTPGATFIASPATPRVRMFVPCPEMVEDSSKIRSDGDPTPPIYTSPPTVPMEMLSAPEVVSIRKSGWAVDEVAMVHA